MTGDAFQAASGFHLSQRGRMHFLDWGNADAPPLILIHGGRDHAHSWDAFARTLRHDWHVIAPDLRGHGESAWSSEGIYPPLAHVYDLVGLFDLLKLAQVTIVAHSMGGVIAMRYTGLFPEKVRRLVVIEGVGLMSDPTTSEIDRALSWLERRRKSEAFAPIRFPTLADAVARLRRANPRLSEEQAVHLTRHGVRRNGDGSVSWKYDPNMPVYMPLGADREVDEELWAQITCPTLLIWGRQSWARHPVEGGYTAYLNDPRVLEIDRAGHWPHHDRFDLFAREVGAFVSEGGE